MDLFNDNIVEEFTLWKEANPDGFTWWNYINMKSDITTTLGFAKFFYPDIIERNGCIFLKDNFDEKRYKRWKAECGTDKSSLEKAMNSYELKDFFHINSDFEDKCINEKIITLGIVLKKFWLLSFNDRFPNRKINVEIIETNETTYITVYEEIVK